MSQSSQDADFYGGKALKTARRASLPGIVVILVLTVFIGLMKLALPLYIFQLFDRVVSSRSTDTLVMLTIAVLIGLIAAGAAEWMRSRMLARWATWIERSFAKPLLRIGLESREAQRPARLLRDLSTIRGFVGGSGFTAWLDVFLAPALIVIVYLIHPVLALVCGVGIVVVVTLAILSETATKDARSDATKASAETTDLMTLVERSGETIHSLKMTKGITERWDTSHSERREGNLRAKFGGLAAEACMRFAENCTRIASYAVGVWLVLAGHMSLGGVVAGAVLARMAVGSVRKAATKWKQLVSTRAAYERLKNYLAKATAPASPELSTVAPLPLVIEDVGHRYRNQDHQIFRKISLTVEPGELVSVQGESGSGKSTLAKIIIGVLQPHVGAVRLGDVDISRFTSDEFGAYLGYLPQDARLFPGTVRENIARMSSGNLDAVVQAARIVNIHEVIIRLPLGYDTVIEEENSPLSGGERKRIALARAFYGSPSLVVLDEPEEHLDAESCAALRAAVETLKARGSIVVVTSQAEILSGLTDKTVRLGTPSRANVVTAKPAKTRESRAAAQEK